MLERETRMELESMEAQLLTTARHASTLVPLQPHALSSTVFMATPEDGPAVVIKRRTRRRAEREQLVCRIAHMFAGAAPPHGDFAHRFAWADRRSPTAVAALRAPCIARL